MVHKYEYQPLPDEESIRVLNLEPGGDGDQLSGTLGVIRLHRPKPTTDSTQETKSPATGKIRLTPEKSYEAISYVWGSDKKDHTILLNGKIHHITANLSDALCQCRLPDQSRVLWADSICIDQETLEEKNHQVYMMGRIYASSQGTLICLGSDPNSQDDARDASGLIANVNNMIRETFQSPGFSWELDCFPWPASGDPLVDDPRWRAVNILLSHPWFSRGWVVQEAALGREAEISWAGCKVAFMDVMRAYTWYFRRGFYRVTNPKSVTSTMPLFLNMFFQKNMAQARVFFSFEIDSGDRDILFALHYARKLGLSDPRDRIFAFMDLPVGSNPMPALRPDYSQPHLELYQDFVIKYLEETSDLSILNYAACKEATEEPLESTLGSSWVPRWDRASWDRLDALIIGGGSFGQKSGKSTEFEILHGENGVSASLQVWAVIFDSIRLVSPQFQSTMTVGDLGTIWSDWSKQVSSAPEFGQEEHSPARDSLAFIGTLSLGLVLGSTDRGWANVLKSYSTFLLDGTQDRGPPGSPQIPPDIQFCHGYLKELANGGHIFLLGGGCYGLAPWVVKQDDVCAFVFGVRMPVILRRVPEAGAHHYKMVCPAFVVGKRLNGLGLPIGLHQSDCWENWEELCWFQGWTGLGLKEAKITLL